MENEQQHIEHLCTPACEGVQGIRGLLEHVGIDTTGRDIIVDNVVEKTTAEIDEEVVTTTAEIMEREHHTDPLIHARNEMVRQLVRKALRVGIPEDSTELETSQNIAYDIIKLFY